MFGSQGESANAMNESYDDSIQYRATHRQPLCSAVSGVGSRKKAAKKARVLVVVEPFIRQRLPERMYVVRVERRGFFRQRDFESLSDARKYRDEQLALAPVSKKGITKYDFSGVDWSKSNQEIAALLGCTVPCVYNNRIKLGK